MKMEIKAQGSILRPSSLHPRYGRGRGSSHRSQVRFNVSRRDAGADRPRRQIAVAGSAPYPSFLLSSGAGGAGAQMP